MQKLLFFFFLLIACSLKGSEGSSPDNVTICDPKSFRIILPKPIKLFGEFIVNVTVDEKELCAQGATYLWALKLVDPDETAVPNVFKFNKTTLPYNYLVLSKADKKTPFYKKMLKITVQLIPPYPDIKPSERSETFVLEPGEMVVKIKGGLHRNHTYGSGNLVLDGTESKDNTFFESEHPMTKNKIQWSCEPPLPSVKTPSSLKWTIIEWNLRNVSQLRCTLNITRTDTLFVPAQSENATQTITIIKLPKPILSVTCVENCNSSASAFKKTILRYDCLKNCIETAKVGWIWTNYKDEQGIYAEGEKRNLAVFKANNFRPGDNITFTVWMAHGSAKINVSFYLPTPKMKIGCVENCNFDLRMNITLNVTCLHDCEKNEYRWNILPNIQDVRTVLNPKKDHITILARTFKDEENVFVEVGSWNGTADFNFTPKEFKAVLEIKCQLLHQLRNCSNVDPRDDLQLMVHCTENCILLNYTWNIWPNPPHFKWQDNVSNDRDLLIIKSLTFRDEDVVTFTVCTSNSNTSLTIEFRELVPTLEIICDCSQNPNPLEKTQLTGFCRSQCDYLLGLTWEITGIKSSVVKSFTHSDGSLVLLPEQTFHDEQLVKFTLHGGKTSVEIERKYFEPVANISIKCLENCKDSNPLKKTVLTVLCDTSDVLCATLQFIWHIEPVPVDFSWVAKIELGENNGTITIKEKTFQDGNRTKVFVTARKAKVHYELDFKEPTPNLSILCEGNNCSPAHPLLPTTLTAKCDLNCDDLFYQWDISPLPNDFNFNNWIIFDNNNKTVSIKSQAFKGGDVITFTVKSHKGSAHIEVQFEDAPPQLVIECMPFCNESQNPLQRMTLTAICMKYCFGNFKYIWAFKPTPKDFDWARQITILKNNESLHILPESFADGANITVEVTRLNGHTSALLNFVEPTPEIKIECLHPSYCWEVNPLNDITFQAVCIKACENATHFSWDLVPPPPNWGQNITRGPQNRTLTIKAETYRDNDKVKVDLKVRKGNSTAMFTFFEQPSVINLTCIENCNLTNPLKNVVLKADCLENCQKLEYIWDISPVPAGWEWKKFIIQGKKNKTLTILSRAFNDTDMVTVSVSSRKSSEQKILKFIEPLAKITLLCVDNCFEGISNPLLSMSFNVTCHNNCENLKYMWNLEPPPPLINWKSDVTYGPKNATFFIKGNLYRDDGSVRVLVASGKSEVDMDIKFIEPTPQIAIVCNNSCEEPNPFEDYTLTASCTAQCGNFTFIWDITPKLRDFAFQKNIKLEEKNKTLTIYKNTFENNEKALVFLTLGKGKSSVSFIFKTPPPFLKLTCYENCPIANPFKNVVLRFNCYYDCDDKEYEYNFDPLLPDFNITGKVRRDKTGKFFIINKEIFSDNQTITFKVWAGALVTSYKIEYVEPIPIIKLRCTSNCKFNPKKNVIIEATCKEHCDHLTYEWRLEPKSPYVAWQNTSIPELVIKGGSYNTNITVTTYLKVRKAAEVNFTLLFDLPEWDGDCAIEPPKGISGVTEFLIECEDFRKVATYRVYQNYPGSSDNLGVLLTYGNSKFTDKFLLSKSEGASSVSVAVGSTWDIKKQVLLKVDVASFFSSVTRKVDYTKLMSIKQVLLGENRTEYFGMINKGKHGNAIQLASLLYTALEETDQIFQYHYKKHILSGVKILSSQAEPTQSLSLLKKLAKTSMDEDPVTIRLIMEAIRATCQKMFEIKSDPRYDWEHHIKFAKDVLQLSSRLIERMHEMRSYLEVEQIAPDYPIYKDLTLPRSEFKKQVKTMTVDLFRVVNALASIVQDRNQSNAISSDKITLFLGENNDILSDQDHIKLAIVGVKSFVIIPTSLIRHLHAINIKFLYHLVYFRTNPFWWDESVSINSEVLQFSIDQSPLLSDPIEVFLNIANVPTGTKSGYGGERVIIEFRISPDSFFIVKFEVVDIPYKATVGSCIPADGTFEKSSLVKTKNVTVSHFSSSSYVYVGIDIAKQANFSFLFSYTAFECFSWGDTEISWKKDLCKAGNNTAADLVHCRCEHMSIFAARAYIPHSAQRSTLDQAIGSEEIINDYLIAFCTLTSIICLLLMLFWGHWKDNILKSKSMVRQLRDNVPGDSEVYLVVVATGIALNAGTTAIVGIQLIGIKGKSRQHLLEGEDGKNLERNSEDFFALFAPTFLGDLTAIKLWHNSQGGRPHWYCERVIIEHLKTRRKYTFIVEKWFSLLYGDGKTYGTFHVSKDKIKMTFSTKLREYVRDNHHLLTLLTQRPRPGTNKETIMVGFVTCACVMMCAILFLRRSDHADFPKLIKMAFVSAGITLPVTMSLNFLFRNSH